MYVVAVFPYVSSVLIASVKDAPAIGDGEARLKVLAAAAFTAKLGVEPTIEPSVAVNVAVWASKRVIAAVPTPLVKFTEEVPVGQVP